MSSGTLAKDGGSPAKTVPFTRATKYGDAELEQLKEALAQGSLFYAHGSKVRQLEEAFSKWIGCERAIATSSGTASVHAAVIAAGISPGDEVILPPITDMGTAIPILFQGAIPVFADLDPATYLMTPDTVRAAITSRTRAVIAVHLAGNSCDLDGLVKLCSEKGLVLIEDCAQSWATTYEGKKVGLYGDYGCYSLNEFKHIGCGDGGMVFARTEENSKRLRLATDKGYNRDTGAAERNPTFLCANYRMTELQGAVALAQMSKVDDIVARRRKWCESLTESIRALPGFIVPQIEPRCEHAWWFYMMRIDEEALGASTDDVCEALQKEGLPVAAHYIGRCLYEYPIFAEHSAFARGASAYQEIKYAKGMCPVAEDILKTCIILPINEGYTQQDLEETGQAFAKVASHFAGSAVRG